MFGESDKNRSQDQGGCREALSTKEGGGKGTAVGTRTGSEAAMRAMSVLENAKSNRHRKTHRVEPDGTGRKFTDLTRGGLRRESAGGVSRGHSSEDARGNPSGAKGRRMQKARKVMASRVVSRDERAPSETGFPMLDEGQTRGGYTREAPGLARCVKPRGIVAVCYPTAGCGKPHVRWCGRVTGRNPRDPIRLSEPGVFIRLDASWFKLAVETPGAQPLTFANYR